jgi:hypothetical protein
MLVRGHTPVKNLSCRRNSSSCPGFARTRLENRARRCQRRPRSLKNSGKPAASVATEGFGLMGAPRWKPASKFCAAVRPLRPDLIPAPARQPFPRLHSGENGRSRRPRRGPDPRQAREPRCSGRGPWLSPFSRPQCRSNVDSEQWCASCCSRSPAPSSSDLAARSSFSRRSFPPCAPSTSSCSPCWRWPVWREWCSSCDAPGRRDGRRGCAIAANSDPGRPKLSEREKEVLTQWFRCESKQIVAHRSGISVRTGGTLLDRVRLKYAKAGRPASTKAALLARAIQDGLVDLDEV